MGEFLARLSSRTAAILAATLIAGFVFVWVQVLTGRTDIASFIGGKVVQLGGYADNLAVPIGWTLHFVISFSYVLAFAVVTSVGALARAMKLQAIVALVLGVATTLLANPAISITISLLAGQGWPEKVSAAYLKLGLPLWNHLGFFVLTFVIVAVIPALFERGQER